MSLKHNLIISDYALNRQVCDYCHKYLSVIPIKVYPNRRMKCGRCSTNTKEDIGVYSMYNKIATRILFKCVNKFDGCTQLLQSSEVVEHEKICVSKKYVCPICSEDIFTFLMIRHFQLNHPESILETAHFQLADLININKHFLYQLENYLLFVHFSDISKSIVDMRSFSLTIQQLGEMDFIKSCKVEFLHFGRDFSSHSSSKMTSFKTMTCHINLNVTNESKLLVMFYLNIFEAKSALVNMVHSKLSVKENTLTFAFQHNFDDYDACHKQLRYVTGEYLKNLFFRKRYVVPNEQFKKTCSDVSGGENSTLTFTKSGEKYIIRFCCDCQSVIFWRMYGLMNRNDHYYNIVCHSCKLSNFNDILIGKTKINEFIQDVFNISFHCIWGCGKLSDQTQLYQHERNCKNQILQKCPVSSCFCYFKLYDFENHFKNEHSLVIFSPVNVFTYYRFDIVDLDTSKLLIKHIKFIWCICVLIKFKWEQQRWKISLTCEIPDVELKVIIYDSPPKEIYKITDNGSIPHYPRICMALYLLDTKQIN